MLKKLIFTLSLIMITAFSQNTFAKKLPSYGLFPLGWLNQTYDLFPIKSQPRPIQVQAWLAIKAISKANYSDMLIIESSDADYENSKKLLNYLVDHHKFPEGRFILQKNLNTNLKGWVIIRPSATSSPNSPPNWNLKHALSNNPKNTAHSDQISTSLASPLTNEQIGNINSLRVDNGSIENYSFKPKFGFQWTNLETDPSLNPFYKASWIGLYAEGDAHLIRRKYFALGINAQAFSSLSPLTPDAQGISIVNSSLKGVLTLAPEPTFLGALNLKLSGGYWGTWRTSDQTNPFLTSIRGGVANVELSTSFDDAFRFGASGGYIFTNSDTKVIESTGFMSHRILNSNSLPWDIQFGFKMTLTKFPSTTQNLQETGTSVYAGLAGAL